MTVLLNANLFEILVNDAATFVKGLDIRSFSGHRSVIRAKKYVIATGGIENARLLLASNSVQTEGLGNKHDQVGRYFSDHVDYNVGELLTIDEGIRSDLYERRPYYDAESQIWTNVTFDTMREHELILCSYIMRRRRHSTIETPGGRALRRTAQNTLRGRVADNIGSDIASILSDLGSTTDYTMRYLWHGTPPVERLDVKFVCDPAPNPDSRVMLSNQKDALGMPRVKLDWRLTELDKRSFLWLSDHFSRAVAEKGLGRLRLDYDWDNFPKEAEWNHHNLSTTRMSETPFEGVVDGNCRMHGINNLYMSGGSIFSTCGGGSPTYLIVALAIRLADHLKDQEGR
jgi:choline dehydrogenase-like flavoprotein